MLLILRWCISERLLRLLHPPPGGRLRARQHCEHSGHERKEEEAQEGGVDRVLVEVDMSVLVCRVVCELMVVVVCARRT